jgi:hypothetical protein
MVIVKIFNSAGKEREVEIVDEKGTWQNGEYHIFSSAFLPEIENNPPEPHDTKAKNFLGAISIEKEKGAWVYNGQLLDADEQQQVAQFILDYIPPDGVY